VALRWGTLGGFSWRATNADESNNTTVILPMRVHSQLWKHTGFQVPKNMCTLIASKWRPSSKLYNYIIIHICTHVFPDGLSHKAKRSNNARMFFFCACFSLRHQACECEYGHKSQRSRRHLQKADARTNLKIMSMNYFDPLDSSRIFFPHFAQVFLATGHWFLVLGCARARVIN
jgi:hypothetical protein